MQADSFQRIPSVCAAAAPEERPWRALRSPAPRRSFIFGASVAIWPLHFLPIDVAPADGYDDRAAFACESFSHGS